MLAMESGDKPRGRQLSRIPMTVSVLMIVSEDESRMVKTRDISDDGVFLLMDDPKPPVGEVIRAQVVGLGDGDAPVVEMEVCALEEEGIECRYRN